MYSCHPFRHKSFGECAAFLAAGIICTYICPLPTPKGSVGASTVFIASGSKAWVSKSGVEVNSSGGTANPADLALVVESGSVGSVSYSPPGVRSDTSVTLDSDKASRTGALQQQLPSGVGLSTVTTKSSSSVRHTRGGNRVMPAPSGLASSGVTKSNSTRESPMVPDKSFEREHSPEILNPSDSENEGFPPTIRSPQTPSRGLGVSFRVCVGTCQMWDYGLP